MVRVTVRVDGAREAALDLQALADRFEGSLRPLLGPIGEFLAPGISDRIRRGEVDLPPQHPATAAIRRHYGYNTQPRLVRGGDLMRSIKVLEVSDTFVAVGSDLEFASTLLEGGTNRTGQQVQPHGFLAITNADLEHAATTILDYVAEGRA